jgi:glycosyltransferase involved in cell wall biosynthesis
MLGLALALPDHVQTSFISFPEGGRCQAFLSEVRAHGFPAFTINADFPRVFSGVRELGSLLKGTACDALLCHGYKANILGRLAARGLGIPAIAVSRGWTGESGRVKVYEWLDRRHLRFMDHVVCVSDGQAAKVTNWCGVPGSRLSVIRNSARLAAFERRDPAARHRLLSFFANPGEVAHIVLAAGRLSPEKGFAVLVEAAASVCKSNSHVGFILFGEGALRAELERAVVERGISSRFLMPGFRSDLDSLIGGADTVVLPSFTEGLPNIALEASAAGVPVVATAVGGTPEVVAENVTGFLVPRGDPSAIAGRLQELLQDVKLRERLGSAGIERMRAEFTFASQADDYLELLEKTLSRTKRKDTRPVQVTIPS